MELSAKKSKNLRKLIIVLSVVIPIAVAALFVIKIPGINLGFLPPIYAGINGLTAFLLILALVFVKQRKLKLHENTIKICMGLSVLFLLCYVSYHMCSDTTYYGDLNKDGILQDTEKAVRSKAVYGVYSFILLTHILLSIVVIPMVLYSYLHAWEGNFDKHKKWTKITWPVWFYVAVTGVVVYFMISPFYGH